MKPITDYPLFVENNKTTNNSVGLFAWIVFFGILIFDFILNTFQLLSQSIRLDEAQSIWASTKSVNGILSYLSKDVATPLYALLLHFWIQIFGPDIGYARMLSLIFLLLTLPVLYFMAKESSNKRVAMLTVVLFSLSPFIMWYTSEARMYTLFTLITSLNHLFFLRILKSSGKSGSVGYMLTTALGLYTHYFYAFLLLTQFIYVLIVWLLSVLYDENKSESFLTRVLIKGSVPLSIVKYMSLGVLLFIPWIIFVISRGSASSTQPLIASPTTFNIFQAFVNFLFGFQANGIQGLLVSLWPLAVIFLFLFLRKNEEA